MDAETLGPLFRRAFRTCKFFPKVAEILEPLNAIEEINFEDDWQALLDYCRRWVSPDIPNPRGKPELPPEIDHAARAAGGLLWIESCPTEELQWAKKRFIEDLQRSRKTGDLAGLLTGGELRKLLRKAAPTVARLPEAIPYTPAIAAARSTLESAGDTLARMAGPICVKRVVDIEGRRAELERQKQIVLQKYPTTGKEAAL